MQTILIVEDDHLHRSLLVEGLEEYYLRGTAELLSVDSYQAAMELIKARDISVLITDMVLGDERRAGFNLIRFLKRHQPRAFVVVVTAYPEVKEMTGWMRAGASEVLPKPFKLNELWAIVQRALELTAGPLDRDMLVERLILEEWAVANSSNSSQDKGIALESLCSMLFGTISGWTQIESRLTLPSEEIDLVITNESADEFWKRYGALVLIECKNWHAKRKPGRAEFDSFFMKLQRRSSSDCRLGFFVSLNGFARTFLGESHRILREPQVIVPLDSGHLWDLIVAADRSVELKQHVKNAVMGA